MKGAWRQLGAKKVALEMQNGSEIIYIIQILSNEGLFLKICKKISMDVLSA